MDGNQSHGESDAPLAIESLDPPVSRRVRLEGTGFYLHGRVQVVLARPRRVRAVVRGARPFDVTVSADETGKTSVLCDCAAFDERRVCRHVWAALIKIQNDGLLASAANVALQ
jgi:uncharacterized Zn finger protein